MSIPNLMSALSQGFNAKQILDWLMNNHKKIGKHIKNAKAQGYNDDQILTYLTKGKYSSHGERNEMLSGMTEQEKGSRIINQGTNWGQIARGLGTAASVAAGAYGLARGIPALTRSGIGQNLLSKVGLGSQQKSTTPTPAQENVLSTDQQQVSQPSTQNIQTQQPVQPQQPILTQPQSFVSPISRDKSVGIIREMGIENQIKNLASSGNSPEAIAAAVNISLRQHQKKFFEEKVKSGQAKPLQETIEDYLSQENQKVIPDKINKIEKGAFVATPNGSVGEIKSERNGKALVDVDGKLEQVEAKDLEMPSEDVREAVEKLLNLPEIEKSSIISSVIYRPSKKELYIKFHNGESYVYEDVDPELMQSVAEGMGIPVTTGKNFYGAWEKGKQDSRGAALIHDIIRNEKYAKSHEGKTWEKLETPYDRYKKLYKPSKRKRVQ